MPNVNSYLARKKAQRQSRVASARGPAYSLSTPSRYHRITAGRGLSVLGRQRAVGGYRTGGFLGIEYKFLDSYKAATLIPATITGAEMDPATANCLNGIPSGDTESSRDGRKYTITGVHVQGMLFRQNRNNQSELGDANWVTVALVLDTQTNGAQLNSEDVFAIPSGSGEAGLVFKNLEYTQRFKILDKQVIVVPAATAAYNGTADQLEVAGTAVPFMINYNGKITVNCSDTGATVADITDNSLHIVAFAHTGGSANANSVELLYNSRVRFVG